MQTKHLKPTEPVTRSWTLAGEAHTRALAQVLAGCAGKLELQSNTLHINLHGGLGAGKTTFARYLLRAMGIGGRIRSPSYAIVEQYCTPDGTAIHHFDFYRFDDPQEWEDAGFREAFAEPGLKLAEWPQKAQPVLPAADIELHISLPEEAQADTVHTRHITATAHSHTGRKTLNVWSYAPSGT